VTPRTQETWDKFESYKKLIKEVAGSQKPAEMEVVEPPVMVKTIRSVKKMDSVILQGGQGIDGSILRDKKTLRGTKALSKDDYNSSLSLQEAKAGTDIVLRPDSRNDQPRIIRIGMSTSKKPPLQRVPTNQELIKKERAGSAFGNTTNGDLNAVLDKEDSRNP